MDGDHFDGLARSVVSGAGTRRAVLRLLLGGAAGVLADRLGPAAGAEPKKPKSSPTTKRAKAPGGRGPQALHQQQSGPQPAGHRKPRHKHRKRCSDVVPLCQDCEEPRCDTRTGQWSCHDTCRAGLTCCAGNGLCEPDCNNGCDYDPDQACACQLPPAGTTYCASQNACVSTDCPTGQQYDSATCQCKPTGVCPHRGPGDCSGDGSGWECGNGNNPRCFCMGSTSGATHCADDTRFNPSAHCEVDSDCDWWFGGPDKGFCNRCNHTCYLFGCPA